MKQLLKGIFGSQLLEREIASLVDYMNIHLTLLSVALREENKEEVKFQKGQLEEIRHKLMELEYFPHMRKA